jgi:RNA polymerase sigma-70 factor (ECF subfamily)
VQEDASFNPTQWSLIVALRSGDAPRASEALEALCRSYWYPLYAYARRCGQKPDDAADLTQAFFSHLLEKGVFARADPDRGHLRTFLLTSMKHFMRDDWRKQQRQKRGAGAAPLSIDEATAEGFYAREPAHNVTPESLYHRRWALTLLERTLTDLQSEYARQGKAELFEALKPTLIEDPDADSAAAVGARLGISAGAVRVAVSRLRSRYRVQLLTEVATSLDAGTEAEVDEEIDALFRALG